MTNRPTNHLRSSMIPRQSDRRWIWSAGLLVCLLLFAAMVVPFWFGRVYVADDLGAFHLPLRDFYSRQLAAGQSWDWMPSLFCGFYATGEGQLGGYHPLHWLLYRTLPLGAAFNLELLASYPLMALGMYLLLCRIIARYDAAVFGAMLFTFCSFNLLHFVHPNAVAVVAHLPWLVLFVDIACRDNRPARRHWACLGVALATGSQLLLGYPQYVWFIWLALMVWLVGRFPRLGAWMRLAPLLAGFAVGGLLGAIQLVPTAELLLNSSRREVDRGFASTGSLHPLNSIQPLAPYTLATRVVGQNTHELTCYLGAVPLALCAWLFVQRKQLTKRERAIATLAAALTAISLMYALGEHGPLSWLQSHVPLVNRFRFPARATVLLQFGVAIFAGLSFARLTKQNSKAKDNAACPPLAIRANPLWYLPAVSLVVSLSAWLAFREFSSSFAWVLAGPLLIGAAVFLIQRIAAGNRWAIVGLMLLAAVDLATYGMSYAIWPKTSDLNRFVAAVDHPPVGEASGRLIVDDRDAGSSLRSGNCLLLAGFTLADGYAGLEPARPHEISTEEFARGAGVAWQRRQGEWQPVPSPLPKFRLGAADGVVAALAERPGHFTLRTQNETATTLIIAESYYPGWQANGNGTAIAVAADGDGFIQLKVPAGTTTVQLDFAPASLRRGRQLSLCGLGLLGAWILLIVARHHKSTLKQKICNCNCN